MNHTPTPWYLDYGGGYGKSHIYSDAFPVDSIGNRKSLGAVHFPPLYKKGSLSDKAFDISDANAAFIIKAANNHERLKQERDAFLKAAKGIMKRPEVHSKSPLTGKPCPRKWVDGKGHPKMLCDCGVFPDLQCAIALAEGEKGE